MFEKKIFKKWQQLSLHKAWIVGVIIVTVPIIAFFIFSKQGVDVRASLLDAGYGSHILAQKLTDADKSSRNVSLDYPGRTQLTDGMVHSADRRGVAVAAGETALFYPFDVIDDYEVVNDDIALDAGDTFSQLHFLPFEVIDQSHFARVYPDGYIISL